MELETISKVNSNYGTAEAVKVSAPKHSEQSAEGANLTGSMTNAVASTSQPAPAEGKGNAEQQGGGQQQKNEHVPSEATIDDAVKKANLRMEHTRCEYAYHKKTNRVSIKVINADTDEVIREIPPEKSLDMLQKMWEMAGILVDEKR